MDGKSKKRKMEKEEEDEEEKMEKFFALLRDTREMREQMMGGVNKSHEEKGKRGEGEKPSFQPEDFMEGANHDRQSKGTTTQPNLLPGSSKREDEAKQEDKREGSGSDGLNLKLSL
ncbi:protein NIM1-INTERACTING 1 [Rhododendron vialii]|uniref:protein NIM1-INTERACTING 1 n=1 Tax=Rhododendron vialii TaxID=182163 RepID=UPI00266009A9|nr:protein NIM1-INTERACTING 1 [Rhododendron vialii]